MIIEIFVFIFLLACSGFFSGAEVALLSIDAQKRIELLSQNDRSSLRILRLLQTPGRTLITILTLNTVVNVAIALVGTLITVKITDQVQLATWIIFLLEVVALTFLLLVVGEITPKMIAQRKPIPFSRLASGPIAVAFQVLRPLTSRLHNVTRRIYNKLEVSSDSISSDDLKYLADLGKKHGTIEEKEHEMIHLIAEFSETSVREIMVSRLDVVAFSTDTSLSEALQIIRDKGFSRYPLYQEYLDNIVGLVYAKDLLALIAQPNPPDHIDWSQLCRAQPMYVPETKKISDLLEEFRRQRTHMAIVLDEHGGTEGLVTLENILEEIVGDIRDEHDLREEALIVQTGKDSYTANGRLQLDDFSQLFELDLDPDDFAFETLAGLILHINQDIPDVGAKIVFQHVELTVSVVENHRIAEVKIRTLAKSGASNLPS